MRLNAIPPGLGAIHPKMMSRDEDPVMKEQSIAGLIEI
jgi:hypothetical protein